MSSIKQDSNGIMPYLFLIEVSGPKINIDNEEKFNTEFHKLFKTTNVISEEAFMQRSGTAFTQ